MNFRRAWDADGWQTFGLQLVQIRHKAQNVQMVPDRVRGDAGIEFFSFDGCLYQCYAPEEVSDVAKAASAMKAKAARDLKKLVRYEKEIAAILQTIKAIRWILLCPFLDDKDVVAHVRKNGAEIKDRGLSFIGPDFEALVQSQADFVSEMEQLRHLSLGPPLRIGVPSEDAIKAKYEGEMSVRLSEKLARAFPDAGSVEIKNREDGCIRAHAIRENALDAMRTDHPVLWERSVRCIEAEERRLVAVGSGTSAPAEQLLESLSRMEQSLRGDLPDLPSSTITDIATGTITDWLFRCPLDFHSSEPS